MSQQDTKEPELIWKRVKKVFDKLISQLCDEGFETMIVSVRPEDKVSHSLCSQAGLLYLGQRDTPSNFLAYCEHISIEQGKDSPTLVCEAEHMAVTDEPVLNFEEEAGSDLAMLSDTLCDTVVTTTPTMALDSPSDASDTDVGSVASTDLVDDNCIHFACIICSKTFKHRWSRTRHMQQCHVDKFPCTDAPKERAIFPCHVCSRTFNYSSSRACHIEYKHTSGRLWLCDQCPATFHGKLGLKSHKDIHIKSCDHVCEICGKAFLTHARIHTHMKRHESENPYKCDVCGKTYRSKSNLTAHILKTKHFSDVQIESELSYQQCEVCGLKLADGYKLRRHLITHNENAALFQCMFCNKHFKEKYNLKIHEKIHTGTKPSCEMCRIIFRSKKKLHEHNEDNHSLD